MHSPRLLYMDLAKAIAIILVCVGHAYFSGGMDNSYVVSIIYSFHMALFMMMCGFFSHHSLRLRLKPFLSKKVRQLLIPALTTSILLAGLALIRGGRTSR